MKELDSMVRDPGTVVPHGAGSDGEAALTVVVPHLNGPDALAGCLDALTAERSVAGPSFTVIVVDNGSRVRPDAVCRAYPLVNLVDEPEPGPGPARSRGARLANTDIIAFVDADCTVQPGWIQAILTHFAVSPGTDVIGGDLHIAFADPGRLTAIEAYEAVFGYRLKQYIEHKGYAGTGNMAVRRDAFLKVGDFAGIGVAEDIDWGRRATAMGMRIDYVPGMVIKTPARSDFAELARKWDRHIGHDFAEVAGAPARLRWILRALALAASPLAEIVRIARSDRLSGMRSRILAFACLTRIRVYRCRRMLGLLRGRGPSPTAAWRGV